MVKISELPPDASPTTTDLVPTVDTETNLTKYSTLANLITLFFNNIPTGSPSPITRFDEALVDFVASGGVWTADSAGVNRNASMSAMVVYINGRRITVAAVTSRTFTASKDTYIDVLDNQDGTGTLVYTEGSNNAASQSLASNSIRIGIIVTGATSIAASTSINQGQATRVLPIASSIPYAVTDSLGNRICNRDSTGRILGYRQRITDFSTATQTATQITGLSVPWIAPANAQIKLSFGATRININAAAGNSFFGVCDGAVSATTLQQTISSAIATSTNIPHSNSVLLDPSAGLHTYNGEYHVDANTGTVFASSLAPMFIMVERCSV